MLTNLSPQNLVNFSLNIFWNRAIEAAPLISRVFQAFPNLIPAKAAVALGILCNSANPNASAIQHMLGSIMYHSGCDKQVFSSSFSSFFPSFSSNLGSILFFFFQ
jgi:hypothetical protein